MTYLNDMMDRIVAMEKEAITTSAAVPYFFYVGDTLPYWTNRLGEDTTEYDSEDYVIRRYSVIMRYVVAHLTEGEYGKPETRLYTDIPTIEDYFIGRIGLNSASYPADQQYLDATDVVFQRTTGMAVFETRGIPVLQVGCEFTLQVPYNVPISYYKWS